MQKGKYLEKKFREALKSKGIWFHRFYDTHSAGSFLPPQPADFLMLYNGKFVFVECKEVQGDLLPYKSFRPEQLKTMKYMRGQGVDYKILILKDFKWYYILSADYILQSIYKGEKSLKIKDLFGYPKIEKIENFI